MQAQVSEPRTLRPCELSDTALGLVAGCLCAHGPVSHWRGRLRALSPTWEGMHHRPDGAEVSSVPWLAASPRMLQL